MKRSMKYGFGAMVLAMLVMAYFTLDAFRNGPVGLKIVALPGLVFVASIAGSAISEDLGEAIVVAVNTVIVAVPFLLFLWWKGNPFTNEKHARNLS
jgi:hypothetical protein